MYLTGRRGDLLAQRLGIQFFWSGTTAFTGSAYIDDVT
jgi:hypothetical protein